MEAVLVFKNLFRFKSFDKQRDPEALYELRNRFIQILEESFPLSYKDRSIFYNRRELLKCIEKSENLFEKALLKACFDVIETIDWPSGWRRM